MIRRGGKIIALLLAAAFAVAARAEQGGGAYFRPALIQTGKGITLHKEMFAAPLSWSKDSNGDQTEFMFQISAKVQLLDMDLYFGFTQKSFWQAYNKSYSSPFRETNYNPEIFYRITPELMGLFGWGADFGVEHESNGKSVPESRSWNRVYLAPYLARTNDLIYLKLWYRIPEERKGSPLESEGDDNPDITHYLGRGELHYTRRLAAGERLHVMLRGNPRTGKGAVSIDYNIPADAKDLYYRVSVFNGYGESLIDYDRSVTRIAFGVAFLR